MTFTASLLAGLIKSLKRLMGKGQFDLPPISPWDWVNLVSKEGHLVLYIVGKLIPLGFRLSMLEGLKVSFNRVTAFYRRVSVLGTLTFSVNIHHNYDQTCYF